ncbi:Lrp/AsnC family transcriptional regulator [Gulosibacter macacae]|uniref:Lrp/AsnC family transcriptional regulator n=1 Tax=Gulosibacter macacae TaxID=2488791 RepID=A0A3P3W284_9MICO|nr:Lrp/AsnC family transcriptional regulator [Gulosibacter macacae]RRJ88627.1 Lrp/AsnC family transcriptional regulator [Gulosibacter macacae]
MDRLDFRIVELFSNDPGTSVLQAARELGIARPTVQARLTRMREAGILVDILPKLEAEPMGYPVRAITTLQIDQRIGTEQLHEQLLSIPEVIDCATIAGQWDVMLRIVARSNADLQRVIERIARLESVSRTSTSIVLQDLARNRHLPLMDAATADLDDEA